MEAFSTSSAFTILCIVCLFPALQAQVTTITPANDFSTFDQNLENIAEQNSAADADYTPLLENLLHYKEHPLNLNTATHEQLQMLQMLDEFQISRLTQHIKKNGLLLSIYELQSIDGFDLQTIHNILPFIKVSNQNEFTSGKIKQMIMKGQHNIIYRYGRVLQQQKGFSAIDSASLRASPASRYAGSPDMMYFRYRFNYGNRLSFGLTCEKDQGELFFKNQIAHKYDWYTTRANQNHKNGFDFYSAHFFLSDIKFIKAIALGDYQATFGQGLTFWSGHAFGKSVDIMSPKKSAAGIRPYTSVDENRFFRGAASTIKIKKFEATAFYSRKKIDAVIEDTLSEGNYSLSSLPTTGIHATISDLESRKQAVQTIYGGNILFRGKTLTTGITAAHYYINQKFVQTQSYYNQFEMQDSSNTIIGSDYTFTIQNFHFYGEQAMSEGGGCSFLNGVLISLDPRLSLSALQRNYQKNFQNQYANSFGEGAGAANEKGFYIGFVAKPNYKFTLTGYYDRFRFDWLKYQVDAPSKGVDMMAQLNYTPSKKHEIYFRIRSRSKYKNTTDETDMDFVVPYEQVNYRLHTSYSILPCLQFKSRIELVNYQMEANSRKNGYLLYQDIIYKKPGFPLSLSLRYALFEAESYDARIYSYESDMPGGFSIPAFSDRGSRFYILLDYVINKHLELWLRYSQTVYDNKNIISEGSLNEISGNKKSEIRVQVRLRI